MDAVIVVFSVHSKLMRKRSTKRVMEEESRDFTMKLNEYNCNRNRNVMEFGITI